LPTGGNATTAINMSAGNYSFQITDINNCTLTKTITIAQPSASLSAVISTNSVLCYGTSTGSASATVNGGTNPYTYTWSPTGGNSLTAINLITGFYFLQITDINNCTLIKTLTIAQPSASLTAVIATNSVLCYGNSTGSALATVNGGTSPYSFSWTPTGGNTLTAINLSVGIYSFQVTDLNNCSLTKTLTIAQPSNSLTATIASNSILCYGYSTGSATATVNGGTLPYLNSWLPFGGTNNFATSLISGTYTFQITDLNNCTLSPTVIISEPSNSLTASITSNSILCFGNATGSASVSANGGTSPFTYTWLPSGGTGTVTNNRIAGNYWVQIKDNNNCPIIPSPTVFISQPLFPLSSSVISNSILCYGNTTGTAAVNLIGGTGPYTYTWLPNSVNTFSANNLAAGNYSIQMSDANNCKLTASVSINGPNLLTSTVNSQGLCLNKTTTLIALVNGGTLPYSYFWNTVAGNYSAAVNSTVTVTYTLNVIDANGCSAPIDTATAYLPIPISLIISPIQTICPTSSAQLSVNASGGLSNYTYKWLPGNWQGPSLGVTILNLTIYTVTVWDGCVAPKTATTSVSLYPIGSPSIIPSSYYGCAPHCVEFINPALNSTLAIQKTSWSFGDIITSGIITPTICFDKDGFYNVTNSYTTQQGCFNKAEMNGQISVLKTPIANFELEKTEINYLTPTMKFNNQSINSNFYIWNFADRDQSYETHPSYNFDEPGFYKITLIAKNSNCSDTIFKLVESKPVFSFYAPNTFSPNDDDKNDIFLPVGEGWKKNTYNLMVFDRWGNKIFDSGEDYVGWDGKNNSKYMGAGVYIWKVSLFDYLGKPHIYTGQVTIY
jgi:gliding motility-associated-like protein